MKIYGIRGVCWTTLIMGEIQGEEFIMYKTCNKVRANEFSGPLIQINEDPHEIKKWVMDGRPDGIEGLQTNYKRSPYVVIDDWVYDLVDKGQ